MLRADFKWSGRLKIAYLTGDVIYNGNFSLYHDLLANYPTPRADWHHRVYLVAPTWDRQLVYKIKERGIDVRSCFEEFQPTTDVFWRKLEQDMEDCDVIISGNITNLDEILPDSITKPIISLSLAEKGYRSPTGSYGSFYKNRFHRAAVSKTAIEAFPEHVRGDVRVVYSGLDPGRLTVKTSRESLRRKWFPNKYNTVKILLFSGTYQESKGLARAIACLEFLPKEWVLVAVSGSKDFPVPEHLRPRVHVCSPLFEVADLYNACDCFILPTEHEGLSMALLEAWYLGIPTVTTKHKTIYELMGLHPEVEFGELVPLDVDAEGLAKAVIQAKTSDTARDCVYQHYMASNMIQRWQDFLEPLVQMKNAS